MKPRKCIDKLKPYGYIMTNRDIAEKYGLDENNVIRFDRNTAYYTLKAVEEAVSNFRAELVRDYPSAIYPDLTELVARYSQVEKSQVVLGNGADEIIELIIKTYLDPGDAAVISTPTFSFYGVSVSSVGGRPVEAEREEFVLDAEKILKIADKENAKIIFICNPNSPTGNVTNIRIIENVVARFNGLVVIDEAYIEFSDMDTCSGFCSRYSNVIVIRTLSKAFGLAGIRVGYALSSRNVAEQLNKVRQPYNIDVFSQCIAEAVLSTKGVKEVKARVSEIKNEKKRLSKRLDELGFFVFPSSTNFLLVKSGDAKNTSQKLLKKGIVVRGFGKGLENFIRITIRSRKENDKLLSEMKKIYDGVIFDVDGVLIDISESYGEVIRRTASELSKREITANEVERIKSIPGSNNDWDVAYALINKINISEVDRSNSEYDKVKDRFQELYSILKNKEKLLINEQKLKSLLARGIKLGIVTGRPRNEVLDVLNRFLPGYFSENCIISIDDCEKEKPDPEPLFLAKKRMGCRRLMYIGDTINDRMASEAASIDYLEVNDKTDVNKIIEVLE